MDKLALILVIIGAFNWGSIALFNIDLVASLFGGSTSVLSRIVYGLVGLAGIYSIKFLLNDRTRERE
ncbi:DUF378 domain-containing protein [Tissierella carlieri]|uniref:DUF378 domain-containing protein n=1 Tax=Tissierella carlieri TaxID=689904 RepID=A0ABT1S8C4_9FIRM|nr:DUF378 domain-containing protein [Tissierella carlieri]MCQ4922716.1 DUF378 domain-containing protein [Tissierella carlieri]MDU5082260.1 DUF378 domain-containing protein [Bacillota bacterium]